MTFEEALQRIPAPGGGGCHPYLMTCANIAAREGRDPEEAIQKIAVSVPKGSRRVSEREIRDTVRKAFHDRLNGVTCMSRPACSVSLSSMRTTTKEQLMEFLHPNPEISPDELYQASPVTFPADDARQQFIEVLTHLYSDHECLFVGERRDTDVYEVKDLMSAATEAMQFRAPPHIIWNPLTGELAKTYEGKESYRCDRAVSDFRYAVAEFDELDLTTQLRFWAGAGLPVVAIVYSGGKSYHGVMKVEGIRTKDAWDLTVKRTLYDRWLVPIGVDKSCSNPSRLSRCPGAVRENNGLMQRLIYLNLSGTPLKLKA